MIHAIIMILYKLNQYSQQSSCLKYCTNIFVSIESIVIKYTKVLSMTISLYTYVLIVWRYFNYLLYSNSTRVICIYKNNL